MRGACVLPTCASGQPAQADDEDELLDEELLELELLEEALLKLKLKLLELELLLELDDELAELLELDELPPPLSSHGFQRRSHQRGGQRPQPPETWPSSSIFSSRIFASP